MKTCGYLRGTNGPLAVLFLAEYARWMVAMGRLSPCCYLRFTAQKKKWVAFHQYGNVSNQIQKSVKQFSSTLGWNCLRWVYISVAIKHPITAVLQCPTWKALGQSALLLQSVLLYSLLSVALDGQGHFSITWKKISYIRGTRAFIRRVTLSGNF